MSNQTLRLNVDSRGLERGAKSGAKSLEEIRRAAGRAGSAADEADASLQRLGRAADALRPVGRALTMFVSAPLVGIAGFAVKAAADMDSLTRALDAMTGSSAETARQMERLKEVARAPGLGFREAVQGSVNLQAVGFAALDAERAMKALGNAVATTGGGKNELDRVLFQLSQMAAAGKVLGQDLRPVIQTAPAVAKALNELFGTTSAEAISSQVDSFEDFFNLLIPKLEQMPSVAGGAQNAFDNLSDSAFRARAALGQQLLPAVIPLIDGFADMLEQMDGLEPSTLRNVIAFGAAAAVIGPLTLGVAGLATAVGTLSIAFGAVTPYVAAGSALIVGLGVLAGLWTKNKLEALDAAEAVDRYRDSLKDMNMAQLLAQRTALQGQKSDVAEQIGNLSGGRGNSGRIAALRERGMDIVAALQDVDRQILRAGTLDPITVTYVKPLTNAADGARELREEIEKLDRALRGMRAPEISGENFHLRGLRERRERDAIERAARQSYGESVGMYLTPVDTSRPDSKGADPKEAADSLAQAASDVTRGIVDVADAFGGLDDRSRRALTGITGLISGLDRLGSGGGALANIGSIAGIIGAGAQLIASIGGGNDAIHRERNDILRRNTDALERLTANLTGNTYGGAASVLNTLANPEFRTAGGVQQSGFTAIWGAGLGDGDFADQMKILGPVLAEAGLTFADLNRIAEDAGITLRDSAGEIIPGALEDLHEALGPVIEALFSFGDSLNDQMSLMNAAADIFDRDPNDHAAAANDMADLLARMAPDLFGGLADLDMGSADDRALMEAAIRDIFTQLSNSELTPEMFGQFGSAEELLSALLSADNSLDAFSEATERATSAMLNIPNALPLELIRQGVYQSIANGGQATPPSGPATPPSGPPTGTTPTPIEQTPIATTVNMGGVTIINEAGDDPEALRKKLEIAVQRHAATGGWTILPNTRTTR